MFTYLTFSSPIVQLNLGISTSYLCSLPQGEVK